MCVSEPVWSQNSKNVIIIAVRCRECSKSQFEKLTPLTDTVLGLYVRQNRYIKLKFGTPDVQAWFYNILYVSMKILNNFDFGKAIGIRNSFFKFLGKKSFLGKSEMAILKNSSFYAFCCLLYVFCLESLFLLFFKHLSISDKKWHDIWSLTSI